MKYNAMIKRLQRRGLTKEDIAKVVAAREKKAAENLAREAVYFQVFSTKKEYISIQLMNIVSSLKKADVNHANNARDVFVKSILQRKEQHELW